MRIEAVLIENVGELDVQSIAFLVTPDAWRDVDLSERSPVAVMQAGRDDGPWTQHIEQFQNRNGRLPRLVNLTNPHCRVDASRFHMVIQMGQCEMTDALPPPATGTPDGQETWSQSDAALSTATAQFERGRRRGSRVVTGILLLGLLGLLGLVAWLVFLFHGYDATLEELARDLKQARTEKDDLQSKLASQGERLAAMQSELNATRESLEAWRQPTLKFDIHTPHELVARLKAAEERFSSREERDVATRWRQLERIRDELEGLLDELIESASARKTELEGLRETAPIPPDPSVNRRFP